MRMLPAQRVTNEDKHNLSSSGYIFGYFSADEAERYEVVGPDLQSYVAGDLASRHTHHDGRDYMAVPSYKSNKPKYAGTGLEMRRLGSLVLKLTTASAHLAKS